MPTQPNRIFTNFGIIHMREKIYGLKSGNFRRGQNFFRLKLGKIAGSSCAFILACPSKILFFLDLSLNFLIFQIFSLQIKLQIKLPLSLPWVLLMSTWYSLFLIFFLLSLMYVFKIEQHLVKSVGVIYNDLTFRLGSKKVGSL